MGLQSLIGLTINIHAKQDINVLGGGRQRAGTTATVARPARRVPIWLPGPHVRSAFNVLMGKHLGDLDPHNAHLAKTEPTRSSLKL